MILVIGTIRLPPESLPAARPAMQRMIEASRGEDGCEEYSYAEDVLEPGLVRVMERWRDRAALDRHFTSPHIATWRAAWPELGIGDRQLRLYDANGPQDI